MQYICTFIFAEQMRIEYEITIDSERFSLHSGPKLNYSKSRITTEEFFIQSHELLFETQIKEQVVDCFTTNGNKAFFKTEQSDFSFDVIAAAFYLLSRYEEYLLHEKDMYARYDYENSLAYREGFLNLPLVNIWIQDLGKSLKEKYPALNIQNTVFTFEPTYDIDIAYSYKHKGFFRNIGGFIKDPSMERIKVIIGMAKDPFDCYDWLNQLHQQHDLKPIFFFLVAERTSQYDKNINPNKEAMWKLVKRHAKKYKVGLHPSWQSGDDKSLIKKEKELLEAMSDKALNCSRQHFIRFNLPEGYNHLINAGITNDYSMGYGSINGFRASVASVFYWYNLGNDMVTDLRVHPFCFMDANAFYEQRQDPQQTLEELKHYLAICRQVNGTLNIIWHNNFLGTSASFAGWSELYKQFIPLVRQ